MDYLVLLFLIVLGVYSSNTVIEHWSNKNIVRWFLWLVFTCYIAYVLIMEAIEMWSGCI